MFVVSPNLRGYVGIGKDGYIAAGFRGNGGALDILIVAEADVHRGIAHRLEELRTRMLVEHPFAECTKLLPLVTTVLQAIPRG